MRASASPLTTYTCFQGCRLVPEGAALAVSRIASMSSRATAVGKNARTERRDLMTVSIGVSVRLMRAPRECRNGVATSRQCAAHGAALAATLLAPPVAPLAAAP